VGEKDPQNNWLKKTLQIQNTSAEMKSTKASKSDGMTGDSSSLDHKYRIQLLREGQYSESQ